MDFLAIKHKKTLNTISEQQSNSAEVACGIECDTNIRLKFKTILL